MTVVPGGLKLVFDAALDGGGWPGTLGGRAAVFGESWVGPLGLLGLLESELGLVAAHATPTERAAELAQALGGMAGYWTQSFDADPLATAQRLLADRDLLALWGWNGECAGEWLEALWAATRDARPGVPDRLRRVLEVLPRRPVDLEMIELVEPAASLPPLWRRVLDALVARGVRLEVQRRALAPAGGDLAAARGARFTPTGDGSLRLVRPQGPLAAAEEVASALAASPSLDGVVVIGADDVLDGALGRHGVPRLGMPRGAAAASALVRLVLATAFQPMDPMQLHALLCADPGPVPRRIASRLARSLGGFPARGSVAWADALEEGLAALDDERREDVASRLAALLEPIAPRDGVVAVDALASRIGVLATWAHRRALTVPSLRGTAVLAERFVALARLTGRAELDRTTLRRLLDEVEPATLFGGPAEVGLASVSDPGAILGPARVVVWWGFTRDSAPAPVRLRLSLAERSALEAAGVTPPDPGAVMASAARRWRRPLEQAREALLLVCPRTDETAERAHPHPLWDELVASLAHAKDAAKLEAAQVTVPVAARRKRAKLRSILAAADTARAPAGLELNDPESPSSLEQLLGCSLAWALQRKGALWGGLGTGPGQPSPLLYGNLAHHVLADVFGERVASPDDAAARAEQLFDGNVAKLAEALLLPDFQTERAELRRSVVESAREVGRLLARTGATVRGMEVEVAGKLGKAAVKGRADLLLESPDAVIDFKWGATTYKDLLKAGAAFQLVAYAALAKRGRALPEVAYLTLRRQQLYAPAGADALDASWSGAHTAREMLDGALARLDERRSELASGQLEAPSAIEEVEKHVLADGVMRLAPKCDYCDFGTVCGRRTRP